MNSRSDAAFDRLARDIDERRRRGGLTPDDLSAWRAAARSATAEAVDDAAQSSAALRALRWALFKLAYDAADLAAAEELLELARPPERAAAPAPDAEPSTPQERLNWGNSQAMMLFAKAELDAGREAYLALAEDYLALTPPDEARFAVLTNAVQAAYELGDYSAGWRLLDAAETLACDWPADQTQYLLALARLFPPLPDCDLALYRRRFDEACALARRISPDDEPTLRLHAALSCLQMGAPAEAEGYLGAPPPDTAPAPLQTADVMVRLQTQIASIPTSQNQNQDQNQDQDQDQNQAVRPELIERGLALFGCPAALEHDWSLSSALARALFLSGRTTAAILLATLFLRRDTVRETLPLRSWEGRERRDTLLSTLSLLQPALIWGDYLQAAEEIASLEAQLRFGSGPIPGAFEDWAPDRRFAEHAAAALAALAIGRDGGDPLAFRRQLAAIEGAERPPALPSELPSDRPTISFMPVDGKLVRIMRSGSASARRTIALSVEEIGARVLAFHRAVAEGEPAVDEAAFLGEALFAEIPDAALRAQRLSIAPFGPVARLPFSALIVGGDRLAERGAIVIRTLAGRSKPNGAPSEDEIAALPETGAENRLRLAALFAKGGGEDRLLHAEAEARAVAALFTAEEAAVTRLSDAGSLRQALCDRPRILHIAAHFRMAEGEPFRSHIEGDDGVPIPTRSLIDADLSGVGLVFLSGCGSLGGAGGESLANQLISRGAETVVAALWPVGDLIAKAIAEEFYAALLDGDAPEVALARSTGRIRRGSRQGGWQGGWPGSRQGGAAPYHWAAFQCFTR